MRKLPVFTPSSFLDCLFFIINYPKINSKAALDLRKNTISESINRVIQILFKNLVQESDMMTGLWFFYHFCHILYEHRLRLVVLRYLLKMFYQKLNIQDRTRKNKSMFSLIHLSRVSFSCLTFLHLKVFYYLCCFIVNMFKMKIIFICHQLLNLKDIKVLFTLDKR